jgi:hypothetical protein
MTRHLFLTAVVLGASASGGVRADPLPEPVAVGTRLSDSLSETHVNGPFAGKKRSLICELAGRPAVLIYADQFDATLLTLLRKLDAVAEADMQHKMRSSCVLLTAGEEDQERFRRLARRENFKATVLAMTEKQRQRPYFGIWPRPRPYYPHKEENVTVILLERLKVRSSYAFRKGELRSADVDAVVKAASTLRARPKE